MVMLVALAFAAMYEDISHHVLVTGRVHRLSLRGGRAPPLDLCNGHLVLISHLPTATQIRIVGDAIAPSQHTTTMIARYFDLLAPGEGRYNVITGELHTEANA